MRSFRLIATLSVAVTLAACPRPPEEEVPAPLGITTASIPDGYRGEAYEHALAADGGAPPYTWTRTDSTAGTGLTVRAGGVLTGVPETTGTFVLGLQVVDSLGETASRSVPLAVHDPVAFVTTTLPDAILGAAYSQSISVSGGKAPLDLMLLGEPPAGLVLENGALQGTPSTIGAFSFELSATDANGRSATRMYALVVRAALAIELPAAPAYVAEAISLTLSVSGGTAPYAFAIVDGALPPGLALSAEGAITGTPTQAGHSGFTLEVTDANGLTATAQAELTVLTPPLISGALADAYVSEAYLQATTASGGEAPYSWSLSAGTLPSGITFAAEGLFSGTPTIAGTYPITVSVTDANGRSAPGTLQLSVYSLPKIDTASLPDGEVGVAYSEQLAASGGKGPLRFTVVGGALPSGLQLNESTGVLSGTPTAGQTANLTLRALDVNERGGDRAFTITIASGATPAVLQVANWNIEWFGSTGNGPFDDDLQLENATRVIAEAGFDVVGVAEVVSTSQFAALVAGLPGYAGFLANDPSVTGGSGSYTASEQKVGFLYDTTKVSVLSRQLILAAYDYAFAGRPPLRVDTRVTIDGLEEDVTFIMVHLKAQNGGVGDWERRADSAAALKNYVDTVLPAANVLVIGDWNDDVDESIYCPSACLETPWVAFLDDAANYTFVTAPLSHAGLRSTVYYDNVIDHHLASNEMSALAFGPPEVVRPDLWPVPVEDYGNTTSDHYPILTRYDFTAGGGGGPAPTVFMNEIRYDEPGTNYNAEFIEVVNAGTANADLSGWTLSDTQIRHVFAPGTILAPGKAIVVFGGASAIGTTPNAVAASTGNLHLTAPADFIDLKRPNGTLVDAFSYSTTPGDGVSMNRSPDGSATGAWTSHLTLSGTSASAGYRANGAAW